MFFIRSYRLIPILLALWMFAFVAQSQTMLRVPKMKYEFDGLKLKRTTPTKRPKVGLVFSGGGARGLAQIGVLRALEKHKVPIDFIVGNSMGSVIGGLYAAGYSTTELESIATHTNWDEVLSFTEGTKRTELFVGQKRADDVGFLTIRFDGLQPIIPSSFSSGQRLINYFMNLTLQALYHPDSTFDDMKIPFRAVAVDLIKGKRTIIDRGSLAEAMRSSITVPLLYTPLERDSMALVDGGLISNIPVDVADSAGCDIIIAVNSTSGLRRADQMTAPWEVADQIMTIIMQQPNEKQLQLADVVIIPKIGERLVDDFTGLDSLIASGEHATEQYINSLLDALKLKEDFKNTTLDSVLMNVRIEVQGKFINEDVKRKLLSDVHDGKLELHQVENRLHELEESGEYADVSAEIRENETGTGVIYYLQSQPMIQKVEFSGNSVISSDEIRTVAEELESRVLNYETIHRTLEKVISLYRRENFSLARITDVQVNPNEAYIHFTINEGIVQDVLCEGNVRAEDYIIRREFPWEYGDVFSIQKANAGLINIASTGLYEYILLDVRYRDEQPRIILKVKERSAELLRFGLHADNEHGIVGTLDLRDANFRGAGEDLSLLLRYGFRDRIARAEYRANRVFNTYLTFNFKGYITSRDVFTYKNEQSGSVVSWERSENGKYRETKIGGSFTFGSQLARLGDLTAEIRTESQKISGISGSGYTEEDHRFVGLKLQTTLDTENKFVFPTEGIVLTLSYETALKSLGSEVSFTKINASWSAYHTFFNKHTIHPHVTVGFADETLPLSEQFSLGGFQTFFGLQEDDSRGRQLFVGSFEYRYSLPFKLLFDSYVSARYDLGTISTLPEELKLSTFRHGLGFTLGLDTPIGAAMFGAGKSFYFRRDLSESPVSVGPLLFYFSIGPNL